MGEMQRKAINMLIKKLERKKRADISTEVGLQGHSHYCDPDVNLVSSPSCHTPWAKDSLDNFKQFLGSADVSSHVTMQSHSKTIHLRMTVPLP